MKLHIDTSVSSETKIALNAKEYESQRSGKSQDVLELIADSLKEENKSLQDISEITVATGPGSFTGLRVGVTVAITLGWALGVPVNGKDPKKNEIPEILY